MKAVIVANGKPADPVADRRQVPPDALIVAADGGADYCLRLGIAPDVIIGDMDSIECKPDTRKRFKDTEIVRHPARKDATDLELAIRLAVERGADSLVILGALGGRWDMSIASLFLPALQELAGIPVSLVDGCQEIVLLTGKNTAVFSGKPGDTLSLIPVDKNVAGVTLEGLEYPLSNAVLALGTSRGISNVLMADKATVSLARGTLICVLCRNSL